MNKLQLPQAKLLYAVSELYRMRLVDQNEKRMLKQRIITDDVEIFQMLEQYPNEKELLGKLVSLVRKPEEALQTVEGSKESEILAKAAQDQPSSPWGAFLKRAKGNNQLKNKHETSTIRALINPQRTD